MAAIDRIQCDRRLAERFRAIGLTTEASHSIPPRHAALRDDPVAIALRLFRDHGSASPEEVFRCLGSAGEGLTRGAGDGLCAAFRLDLIHGLFLFSDWPAGDLEEALPPGEITAILYRAAAGFDGGRVLDLGCGSGTLALLLAGPGVPAVGTDVNPRAIALARLNARVNDRGGVEFREGSLYQPVRNESFDLIVSQPPFIPSAPGVDRHIFLHGGERGDELARAIIAGSAEHLAPDGRAFVFSDWALRDGERLADRIPHERLRATLYVSRPIDPAGYAASYSDELAEVLRERGITGIRQCLTVIEHGEGLEQHEVLPHQWGEVNKTLRPRISSL